MGTTTWPCPKCGQQQTAEHPNGSQPGRVLCAACAELVGPK